ncbi:MAG: hypothetical protein WC269_06425, partial [Candidatus Gracilibacteria bacterium]
TKNKNRNRTVKEPAVPISNACPKKESLMAPEKRAEIRVMTTIAPPARSIEVPGNKSLPSFRRAIIHKPKAVITIKENKSALLKGIGKMIDGMKKTGRMKGVINKIKKVRFSKNPILADVATGFWSPRAIETFCIKFDK